jgi:methylphosphotriester-DNA--protein-cysteine methyltransferase
MALAAMSKKRVELDPYEQVVYFTRRGKVYHRRTCPHLRSGRKPVSFRRVPAGATPCGRCKPEGWAPLTDDDA